MNNKFPRSNHYHSRRKSNITPFSLNLTDNQELQASLFYSKTLSKLIELDKIEKPGQVMPEPSPFEYQNDGKKPCGRKDCLDRKFEGIKKLNKSAPNVKMVSPRKVDIVLTDQGLTLQKKRDSCIHSARFISKRPNPERDLLKEFKQLEEMRKELRSRNYKISSRASFYVSPGSSQKLSNLNSSHQYPERANKSSSLYLEVKARISKRYNSMFKKITEGARDMKAEGLLLKDICSARSFRKKPIN